jgi:nucleoside-diphosphate-sugar epimerase
MIKGLRNVIKASKQNKIEKFIHIGSIAIYGDNPAADSGFETAIPNPGTNSYGAMKLKQDQVVFGLHASGVPSIILCPSNISGPYSVFVLNAVERLLSDEIVLVDEGKYPTNLIHVDNLVEAILAAIESDKGWGERYFINEVEKTTWREFFEELKQMLGLTIEFKSVSRDEALNRLERKQNNNTISHNARLLLSRDVRNALTVLPALKSRGRCFQHIFWIEPRYAEEIEENTDRTGYHCKRHKQNRY